MPRVVVYEIAHEVSYDDFVIDVANHWDEKSIVSTHLAERGPAAAILKILQKTDESDSNLVRHAKRELEALGTDADDIQNVLDIIAVFASQGHSGGSASWYIPTINDLLQFKNLSPLTDNPAEWNEIGPKTWQSARNSEAFSTDGGETYYLLSERVPIHYSDHYEKPEKGASDASVS